MADDWLLLVPTGITVETFPSSAVDQPTLTTRRELTALAALDAARREQGLPSDLASLLQSIGGKRHPGQQQLPVDTPVRAVETHTFGCVCGIFVDSQLKLHEHQKTCGVHHSLSIPEDRKVDS
jgi:hypothetical protein